jgi:chromosome partitioning protein
MALRAVATVLFERAGFRSSAVIIVFIDSFVVFAGRLRALLGGKPGVVAPPPGSKGVFMSIVSVMSRSGGCGKSTLATHIAAWRANAGATVMLGNLDRQRSAQAWLGRRSASCAPIQLYPVCSESTLERVPGCDLVVLDTPGGIPAMELARHLARVDAVVIPVGPSVPDLTSSVEFFHEVSHHPRVSSGGCPVVLVGMRWPHALREAAHPSDVAQCLPLLTVIPDSPVYRSSLGSGDSLFDSEPESVQQEMLAWRPLLQWLQALPGAARGGVGPMQAAALRERRQIEKALPVRAGRRFGWRLAPLSSQESFIETQPPMDLCGAPADPQRAGATGGWRKLFK